MKGKVDRTSFVCVRGRQGTVESSAIHGHAKFFIFVQEWLHKHVDPGLKP
jgi:hypothetical protein